MLCKIIKLTIVFDRINDRPSAANALSDLVRGNNRRLSYAGYCNSYPLPGNAQDNILPRTEFFREIHVPTVFGQRTDDGTFKLDVGVNIIDSVRNTCNVYPVKRRSIGNAQNNRFLIVKMKFWIEIFYCNGSCGNCRNRLFDCFFMICKFLKIL